MRKNQKNAEKQTISIKLDKGTWVQVGRVGKAKGLDGTFFVVGRSEALDANPKVVAIGNSHDAVQKFDLISLKSGPSKTAMKVSDISQREMVQDILGQNIYIDKNDISIDEEEEFFWADLEGKLLVDNEGTKVGVVIEVYNSGASDVVVIEAENGSRVDIPLVDSYINMDFRSADESLHLKVSISVFADFFYE